MMMEFKNEGFKTLKYATKLLRRTIATFQVDNDRIDGCIAVQEWTDGTLRYYPVIFLRAHQTWMCRALCDLKIHVVA